MSWKKEWDMFSDDAIKDINDIKLQLVQIMKDDI